MAITKAERLLDLVIALLNTRYFRNAQWIREHVAGYDAARSDEAFSRMLERDKQELRHMGIPVETGGADGDGYRIVPGEFALPPMSFTAQESVALALASRLWDTTVLREAGSTAIRKLRDASDDEHTLSSAREVAPDVHLRIRTPEPSFAPLLSATKARREVRFDYRAATRAESERRRLQPWGLVSDRGVWYVVGFDCDRRAPRTFRLSRIVGDIAVTGKSESYRVPPDMTLRDYVSSEVDVPRSALLKIRAGRAAGLRRGSTLLAAAEQPAGFDDVQVPMSRVADLARRVASDGPDVIAVDPPELVESVIGILTDAARARSGAAANDRGLQ